MKHTHTSRLTLTPLDMLMKKGLLTFLTRYEIQIVFHLCSYQVSMYAVNGGGSVCVHAWAFNNHKETNTTLFTAVYI